MNSGSRFEISQITLIFIRWFEVISEQRKAKGTSLSKNGSNCQVTAQALSYVFAYA
jgi:hypothetical protein